MKEDSIFGGGWVPVGRGSGSYIRVQTYQHVGAGFGDYDKEEITTFAGFEGGIMGHLEGRVACRRGLQRCIRDIYIDIYSTIYYIYIKIYRSIVETKQGKCFFLSQLLSPSFTRLAAAWWLPAVLLPGGCGAPGGALAAGGRLTAGAGRRGPWRRRCELRLRRGGRGVAEQLEPGEAARRWWVVGGG